MSLTTKRAGSAGALRWNLAVELILAGPALPHCVVVLWYMLTDQKLGCLSVQTL